MNPKDLATTAENTWCPGCGNFGILNAWKALIPALAEQGVPRERIVVVTGIGCHAKIADYVNNNSFYSIHGRVAPVAQGIKIAKPGLKVIGFAGDGDAYGEGLEHLLFAAKRNVDFTMFIHNNRVYGLTTGQYTPTSPLGFKGRSTPRGTFESPFNPLELLLAAGAGFVGRAYSGRLDALKAIMKKAILHPGFAVVDVLQVCATFFNVYDYYNQKVYEIEGHDPADFDRSCALVREWDYSSDAPIALGTFYEKQAPRFEESFDRSELSEDRRREKLMKLLGP